MRRMTMAAVLGMAVATALGSAPTDNPVSAFYAGPEGWPAWTAGIAWKTVFDITDYGGGTARSGAENFAAFEKARDAAYAAGGGVVYFAAGTYDIELPDTGAGPGNGPTSRGLMLRSGVVIRGETPSDDLSARSTAAFPADGQLNPPTRLRFARRMRLDEEGIARSIPCDWNLVGLMPEPGQGIKDMHQVGVVWIELVNATIFWGAQYGWAATWNDSTAFLGPMSKNTWPAGRPWSARIPDGTHPGDSFCGVSGSGSTVTYAGAGRGRLVFGVKLTDGAVVNDFYWAGKRGADGKAGAFSIYRFCGRIGVYGGDVFIANNILPMSETVFVYRQWTQNKTKTKAVRDVLWDSCNAIGIDINKSLSGLAKPDDPGMGYYEENIIVQDNWVFNRGNKGYEISGQHAVVRNNHNHRYYLGYTLPPSPYPNPGGAITAVLDGFSVQISSDGESASDFLSRGYDLGGRDLWVDSCTVVNTGSVGNDGEGVMSQRHNNFDIYGWAFSDCRQWAEDYGVGTSGEKGWIGSWGQNIYGFLLLRNTTEGYVGHAGPGSFWMLDMSCAGNRRNDGSGATLSSAHSGTRLPKDFESGAPTAAVHAPTGLAVAELADRRGIRIEWTDTADNETGFRIERRINGGPWRVIAYRPRINASKTLSSNEDYSPTPIDRINTPVWVDYGAPRGRTLEYRVFAIHAGDDSNYGSPIARIEGMAADLNDDGRIGPNDLTLFAAEWTRNECGEATENARYKDSDFNRDCRVNLPDFAILAEEWLVDTR